MHLKQTIITALAIAGIAAVAGCQKHIPALVPSKIAEPAAADIESVIFLLGDAGAALRETNPVLRRMQADVERWAGSVQRDSAVIVLYLGDIVYPAGVHAQTDPQFAHDSAVVQGQVDIVNGPQARDRGVRGIFIAGNHDWGQTKGLAGLDRLKNLESLLDRRRAQGTPVWLMPKAGVPGPQVIDMGRRMRLLILDSAWWLLAGRDTSKADVYNNMRNALETSGERDVLVAAHHPFRSASSHGGLMPFWSGLGIRYLLNRSGAVLQDLSSIPYREFTDALLAAFAVKAPLVFAGGHDHNMQVLKGLGGAEPKWVMVSGAGSKEDNVGYVEGMQFRHAAAGYIRVMVHRSGRVDAFVIGASGDQSPICEQPNPVDRDRCMVTTAEKFTDIYSVRLK